MNRFNEQTSPGHEGPPIDEAVDTMIVWRPLVEEMTAYDRAWVAIRRLRQYELPDGSLVFDRQHLLPVVQSLTAYAVAGNDVRQVRWRSLPFWPEQITQLMMNDVYMRKIKREEGLIVFPTWGAAPLPDLSPREVSVWLEYRRSPRKEDKLHLAAGMAAWNQSPPAIPGEGPLRVIPDVTFSKRVAHFRIDVSQCGPATLDWFTVLLLDLTVSGVAIQDITYGVNPAEL